MSCGRYGLKGSSAVDESNRCSKHKGSVGRDGLGKGISTPPVLNWTSARTLSSLLFSSNLFIEFTQKRGLLSSLTFGTHFDEYTDTGYVWNIVSQAQLRSSSLHPRSGLDFQKSTVCFTRAMSPLSGN